VFINNLSFDTTDAEFLAHAMGLVGDVVSATVSCVHALAIVWLGEDKESVLNNLQLFSLFNCW
jgi:hypothetical protein